jgi:diguanylate cyclase (GGDEF)-like protein
MNEAIFRIGGDEFTAIVAGVSLEEMKELAEKLVRTVNSPYIIDGHTICISCSIGISIYPDQSDNADTLIKYADTAMYRAKTTKNMYYFWDSSETE